MKRYRLKRDLPTFKAGDEFYLDRNNDLRLKGSDIMAYNHKTLEKFPNVLTDWFEEVYETYKRWRAELMDNSYYISRGVVDVDNDTCSYWDNVNYKIGNYFKTEEEVKAYMEYLLARQVLLDDAGGWKFTLKEKNYFTNYSVIDNCWHLSWSYHYAPGGIYFKDIESLEKSLEEHKAQWETVRKYEMGEM